MYAREISIHAAHAGCDVIKKYGYPVVSKISIHAAHAGCDDSFLKQIRGEQEYFNPRSPCGLRPDTHGDFIQSFTISIHAAHAGCDTLLIMVRRLRGLFQSTQPMRAATSSLS